MTSIAPYWHETRLDSGIVTVRFDRPPANALTGDILIDFEAQFTRLESARDVAGVVLLGREKVFSAGMDLKMLATLDADGQRGIVDALNRAYGAMYRFGKPLVAAAEGHAIAGGLFLLLTADYRIGAEGPLNFGLSEVRVGVPFPVAPLEIARAELTPAALRQLMLSGQPVGPGAALGCGILDEVATASDLEQRAIAVATELAANPGDAYARVKRQIRGPVIERITRAVAGADEPMLAGWFSPDTTHAALEVLAGRR